MTWRNDPPFHYCYFSEVESDKSEVEPDLPSICHTNHINTGHRQISKLDHQYCHRHIVYRTYVDRNSPPCHISCIVTAIFAKGIQKSIVKMNGLQKGCVLAVVFTAAIAREIKVDWASDRIQARNNGRLRSLTFSQSRNLQDVNCDFLPHGRALSCTEQTASGNNVRYSVTCPAGVTTVEECLQDQSRICYQFNSFPCIGSFFCASTNRFSLDCGNLFASSNGNTCSATDCTGNCTELLDATVNYNAVDLDNDCFRLGLVSPFYSLPTFRSRCQLQYTHDLSFQTICRAAHKTVTVGHAS